MTSRRRQIVDSSVSGFYREAGHRWFGGSWRQDGVGGSAVAY
jgi:hypothetical protein